MPTITVRVRSADATMRDRPVTAKVMVVRQRFGGPTVSEVNDIDETCGASIDDALARWAKYAGVEIVKATRTRGVD